MFQATDNTVALFENQKNATTENLLPPKQTMNQSKTPKRPSNYIFGYKLSHLCFAIAIGVIILIEMKIMFKTTEMYNASLVNQLNLRNEILEENMLNLTKTMITRNTLLEKLLELSQKMNSDNANRTGEIEDKIVEVQELVVRMAKENKVMYETADEGFIKTLGLVRDALVINSNTVSKLLDENGEILVKLRQVEESVAAAQPQKGSDVIWNSAWATMSGASSVVVLTIALMTLSVSI